MKERSFHFKPGAPIPEQLAMASFIFLEKTAWGAVMLKEVQKNDQQEFLPALKMKEVSVIVIEV